MVGGRSQLLPPVFSGRRQDLRVAAQRNKVVYDTAQYHHIQHTVCTEYLPNGTVHTLQHIATASQQKL